MEENLAQAFDDDIISPTTLPFIPMLSPNAPVIAGDIPANQVSLFE